MREVVGAFESGSVKLEDGSELRAGVIVDPDKTVHEIEIQDTLATQPSAKVLEELQKIADENLRLKPHMKKSVEKGGKR